MASKTVLISGAGIGGPTLAYWLKAAGFEPTIIEHAPKLRSGGYVIDFWVSAPTLPNAWACRIKLKAQVITFVKCGS